MKTIFKKDDIVYHYQYGEGRITAIYDSAVTYKVRATFKNFNAVFTSDGRLIQSDGPTLSFKPYDLVNGGFSQERPIKLASKEDIGKLVKCWDDNRSDVLYTEDKPFIGILSNVFEDATTTKYKIDACSNHTYFKNAKVLTIEEFTQLNS